MCLDFERKLKTNTEKKFKKIQTSPTKTNCFGEEMKNLQETREGKESSNLYIYSSRHF